MVCGSVELPGSVDYAAQYLAICFGDCLASGVTYVITTTVSKTMDVPSKNRVAQLVATLIF